MWEASTQDDTAAAAGIHLLPGLAAELADVARVRMVWGFGHRDRVDPQDTCVRALTFAVSNLVCKLAGVFPNRLMRNGCEHAGVHGDVDEAFAMDGRVALAAEDVRLGCLRR